MNGGLGGTLFAPSIPPLCFTGFLMAGCGAIQTRARRAQETIVPATQGAIASRYRNAAAFEIRSPNAQNTVPSASGIAWASQ